MGQFFEIGPESHFIYPNSNVKSLGPVKATIKTQPTFGMPSFKTGDQESKLYYKALGQVAGADVIIDYIKTTTLYQIPIVAMFYSKTTIEGTAAKMEIGRQVLR